VTTAGRANTAFVVTPGGEELVLVPKADYEALLQGFDEAVEDAADVAIYDARRAENSPALPAEVSMAMLRGDSLLRALRKWKGLSQVDLARAVGTSQGLISDLEHGRRATTRDSRDRIAKALDVPTEWLP
jgi:ribosome-binding protein aMBF1 (putative translation factor)